MTTLEAGLGAQTKTVSATEFKATWLDLLEQVTSGAIARLEVTRRGKVVAVVTKPEVKAAREDAFGSMRGRVIIPEGLDLTAPLFDEEWDAERGILRR